MNSQLNFCKINVTWYT